MGVIIRNGIEYSGAGMGGGSCDCDIVYLTQEEYDALPASKKSDNVEYRITDANTSSTVARNIAYDNSESGIEATSVQGAIDVMNDSLGVVVYREKDSVFADSQYIENCYMTKCGSIISLHVLFKNLPSNSTSITLKTKEGYFKPSVNYPISPFYDNTAAELYAPKGSVWFYSSGDIQIYKPATLTQGFCYVSYITMD